MKVKGNKWVWYPVLFIVYLVFVFSYPKLFFLLFCISVFLLMLMLLDIKNSTGLLKYLNPIKEKIYNTKTNIFLSIIILFFTFFFSLIGLSSQEQNKPIELKSQNTLHTNKNIIKPRIVNKPKEVKLIPYKLYDETTMLKSGTYNLIQCWIVADKIGDYSVEQIKLTLRSMVNKVKTKYPNYDYISVYFFEREIDFKNQQPFNLGMVDYGPKDGFITLDNNANIQDKQSYKYFYTIKKRIESERPSKKEQDTFDMFYSISTKNPNMPEETINKIIEKKLKITPKQNEEYFLKSSTFYNFENISITE